MRSVELTSDGVDYLAVYSDSLTLRSLRLDENGRPLDAPRGRSLFGIGGRRVGQEKDAEEPCTGAARYCNRHV